MKSKQVKEARDKKAVFNAKFSRENMKAKWYFKRDVSTRKMSSEKYKKMQRKLNTQNYKADLGKLSFAPLKFDTQFKK
jgi:hypothetical protein